MQLHPDMLDNSYYGSILDIEKVEARYGAKYVGEFPGKTKHGWTDDVPVSVFYQADPPEEYPNHYFGLFLRPLEDQLFITNADYIEGKVFDALKFDDGIVYSTCRHDYRKVNGFDIDGGWDYVHARGGPLVSVRVMNGEFEEVENEPAGD